jgi:hypothetical protein
VSGEEQVQRSRIARRVFDLWGEERLNIDAGLIESASKALARINALQPEATNQLDRAEDKARD